VMPPNYLWIVNKLKLLLLMLLAHLNVDSNFSRHMSRVYISQILALLRSDEI
jgi:hypothetical protein